MHRSNKGWWEYSLKEIIMGDPKNKNPHWSKRGTFYFAFLERGTYPLHNTWTPPPANVWPRAWWQIVWSVWLQTKLNIQHLIQTDLSTHLMIWNFCWLYLACLGACSGQSYKHSCNVSLTMYTVGVIEGSWRVIPITWTRLNPMYLASDTLSLVINGNTQYMDYYNI